jgi:hypothetical protein
VWLAIEAVPVARCGTSALLVAELFWSLGDKDSGGLLFGVAASTVLLLGALMARAWRQVKARLNAR